MFCKRFKAVYHHLPFFFILYSSLFSFPQIDCISLLSEANPRAQQTHISSAQMMNLYMKSTFLTAHIWLFHFMTNGDFMVHFCLKLLCRFWTPQSGNAVQILLQTEQKTKGKIIFFESNGSVFALQCLLYSLTRNSYFTHWSNRLLCFSFSYLA